MTKQRKTKRKDYRKAAAKASGGVRDAVASKWSAEKQRRFETARMGSFGPAGPVKTMTGGDL